MGELEEYADAFADAVDEALPRWVEACVAGIYRAWSGSADLPESVATDAAVAAEQARLAVGGAIRTLLRADIDQQRATPLQLWRGAVSYPTEVLRRAGVPDVVRDSDTEAAWPEDRYGLTPASLADIDAALHERGLEWGAAKAWTHRMRHAPRAT